MIWLDVLSVTKSVFISERAVFVDVVIPVHRIVNTETMAEFDEQVCSKRAK